MVLSPPTALWVVPVSDLAGVARHVLDVARAGIPGWRLVFLAPPGDLPERLRELGSEVVEGRFGPDHGLRASVTALRDVVRRVRPAVVHSHLAYADIVAALAVPVDAAPESAVAAHRPARAGFDGPSNRMTVIVTAGCGSDGERQDARILGSAAAAGEGAASAFFRRGRTGRIGGPEADDRPGTSSTRSRSVRACPRRRPG